MWFTSKADDFEVPISWRHIKDCTLSNSVRTDYIGEVIHILCAKIEDRLTAKVLKRT
jgi:hypothetical protein